MKQRSDLAQVTVLQHSNTPTPHSPYAFASCKDAVGVCGEVFSSERSPQRPFISNGEKHPAGSAYSNVRHKVADANLQSRCNTHQSKE